ncbi:LysR family transcriptional regulator [Sneathiella chungangensis]|uniref:LysR family transcriptional regulator n=1 Tax=Sneathiella chungangensis TaxID=1418234 RepID=A0A845ME20_9PROT|nr:LysR family transcriptional regulator [Sneathiella chungangensis]MZR21921.1 LysR family transcriptional regulator [Sneathiella chungangensis]
MNNMAPNLRHLRAFCVVAAHQSISRASEEVFLSQPAITQAIAKFEQAFDIELFTRRTDGVFITDAGKLFLVRAERAQEFIRTGIEEARRIAQVKSGKGFSNLDQLVSGVQLRALIAIAKTGNFSLAARHVGISQPSLYRAARDLERLSAMVLFRKSGQGIELTPAAEIWARYAKLAFAELRQGYTEIEEYKGIDVGRIVIGTMPLARTYILPTAITRITQTRPGVEISVIDGRYEDLLHGLRYSEIDILIGALRNPPPIDDVVEEKVFEDELALFVRVDHPLTRRKKITLEQLAGYPWITPREGSPTRTKFEELFAKRQHARPKSLVEASSLILIRGLLMDSDRITILSAHQTRHEQEQGLLVQLPFDLGDTRRPIGLTTRRDWHPTAAQAEFLDALRVAGGVMN